MSSPIKISSQSGEGVARAWKIIFFAVLILNIIFIIINAAPTQNRLTQKLKEQVQADRLKIILPPSLPPSSS